MESSEKNKQLFINKKALATFSLAQEGILGNIDKFMNKDEARQTNETGFYKGSPVPFSFILAPNGKRNQDIIQNAKKGETIELINNDKIVGKVEVEGCHKIDKYNRIKNIFGLYDDHDKHSIKLFNAFGEYALSGKFTIDCDKIKKHKQKIQDFIKNLNAKKVTGLMLGTKVLNRSHERLIRIALDQSDLLVLFIKEPNNTEGIPFRIREKALNYLIDNYLPNHKIVLIPLESTYLFYGNNNLVLQCLMAANFGCTDFIMGYNHQGIGIYYDENQTHFSLDKYKNDLPINISMFPEFVFCNECKTLVSTSTCPHGTHHHVKYHGESINKLLMAGILPPALFVRRDISSIILSELFPKRFKNVQTVYDNLFPNNGLLEEKTEKDFYEELMKLYQTTSLV